MISTAYHVLMSNHFQSVIGWKETHNRTHERQLAVELREDMLHHELFNIRPNLRVLHHEVAKRSCHIQGTELLWRRGVPGDNRYQDLLKKTGT